MLFIIIFSTRSFPISQLVALLLLIRVAALSDPYRLSYEL